MLRRHSKGSICRKGKKLCNPNKLNFQEKMKKKTVIEEVSLSVVFLPIFRRRPLQGTTQDSGNQVSIILWISNMSRNPHFQKIPKINQVHRSV